jgi:hypothetical protein
MDEAEQDALEEAWAHHEQLARQFQEETREQYPQWFESRKVREIIDERTR